MHNRRFVDSIFFLCEKGSLDRQTLSYLDDVTSLSNASERTLLHRAIECKQVHNIQLLLNYNFMTNVTVKRGYLMYAVRTANIQIVEMLLDHINDIRPEVCGQPLNIARHEGYDDILRLILWRACNCPDLDWAMRMASQYDQVDILRHLIDAGVTTHRVAGNNSLIASLLLSYDTPYTDKRDDVLSALIDAGCSIDYEYDIIWRCAGRGASVAFMRHVVDHTRNPEQCFTVALLAACEFGRRDIAEYLLTVAEQEDYNVSPYQFLDLVAAGRHMNVFRLLLTKFGIDPTDMHECYSHDKILLYAATCGCADVVSALIATDKCDLYKLHDIAFSEQSSASSREGTVIAAASDPDTVKVLLDAKANVHNWRSVPVLATACKQLQPMAVKMLTDAKADVNRDVDGKNTLLQYAMGVSSGCVALVAGEPIDVRISIINLLLTAGAKTRGLRDGFTALTLCCDSEAPMWLLEPVIRALVSHDRTLLDEVDENGWTPVTMAVSKTNAPVVKILLDMGAGIDKKPSKHTRSQLPVLFHLRHMFGYCFPCESARSILCMLLDAGADPTECDDDGRTVFMNIWEKMRRDNLRRMNIPRSDRFIHDYVADILIVDIINHILSVPSRSVARQD